ncbi:MAG TPA: c-type cytochrome [Gaiellaceae bacterium]|jgi:cytochrome c553|nr:c-type cytochrome [Gaiellaceae bacterium]
MVSTALIVGGTLSTGHKIGLIVVAAAFIVFALVSSFVLPRRNPDFPGKSLGWYVVVCICFFLAMIAAVLVFGKETETTPASAAETPAATPPSSANADAGKQVFVTASCGSCHTMKAAGSNGEIGPNLDQLKPSFGRIVHQVQVGGGPMPAFKGQLSDQQIQDVAAYVYKSTHS